MKTFKNKKTGKLGYYENGVFKQDNCCVEIGVEPSSEFWEKSFVTEDGAIRFNNDNVAWYITDRYAYMLTLHEDHHKLLNEDDTVYKIFSTEEKAREYEALNRKSLFTTEDGVEIFEGDQLILVTDKLVLGYLINFSTENLSNTKGKIFAKKENAEKFIKNNKKVFSLQDIKDVMKQSGCFGTTLTDLLAKQL